jgi:hypothetical protein
MIAPTTHTSRRVVESDREVRRGAENAAVPEGDGQETRPGRTRIMRKIVLVAAVLAMTLFAAMPAFAQSFDIQLDDSFASTIEETIVFDDQYGDGGSFNIDSSVVGTDDSFADNSEFDGFEFDSVGSGGFVLFAGDDGAGIIDFGIFEEQYEEGAAAAEGQYATDDQY